MTTDKFSSKESEQLVKEWLNQVIPPITDKPKLSLPFTYGDLIKITLDIRQAAKEFAKVSREMSKLFKLNNAKLHKIRIKKMRVGGKRF